jgi:hypothetical protein
VTLADQKLINRFGQLNARLQDLKDEVAENEEAVQNLQDAVSEIEATFDDDVARYVCMFVGIVNQSCPPPTLAQHRGFPVVEAHAYICRVW